MDHTAVHQITARDLDLGDDAIRYHQEASRALACGSLAKYLPVSYRAQKVRNDAGKNVARYEAWEPPLMDEKCSLAPADIIPLPTLAKNEAMISETIEILQEYAEGVLGLEPSTLSNMSMMINGDLMTVRNINRAIHRRQDEHWPERKLDWAKPVAGLFHTQMTALKMLYHVFWGQPDATGSILRFKNVLRRKKVDEKSADFHHCNQLFLLLVDAYLLALMAHECGCESWEDFAKYISTHDWRSMVDRVVPTLVEPYTVHNIRTAAEETARSRTQFDMRILRAQHELRVVQGTATRRKSEYWTTKEDKVYKERLLGNRDLVRENALLFLSHGLVYREFHNACRGGFHGRAIKCLEQYTVMFQGSRNYNYARECVNMVAHMRYGWKEEFLEAFKACCLINPTGREGKFHPIDRFNEHEIRELKAMIHPSSNPDSDEFFRRVVAFNFISLASVKLKIQHATGSTDYGDRHQAVSDTSDIRQVFDILIKDKVFQETLGRPKKKDPLNPNTADQNAAAPNTNTAADLKDPDSYPAVDLIALGSRRLAHGKSIDAYVAQARGRLWDQDTPHLEPPDELDEDDARNQRT